MSVAIEVGNDCRSVWISADSVADGGLAYCALTTAQENCHVGAAVNAVGTEVGTDDVSVTVAVDICNRDCFGINVCGVASSCRTQSGAVVNATCRWESSIPLVDVDRDAIVSAIRGDDFRLSSPLMSPAVRLQAS